MANRARPVPLWKRFFGGVFYLVVLAVTLTVGTAAGWLNRSPVAVEVVRQELFGANPERVFNDRSSLTLLLLGCDEDLSYGGAKVLKRQARADMMLVAKLDFANNRISGVSIPRDTYCRLPGYRGKKINAYHAIAPAGQGGELTRQAVEHLLPGVSIDRVVTLDYEAFQRMVNLVGGVSIDVQDRLRYHDEAGGLHIDLQPGPQRLDGYQAMGFVRYRHGDSDFKRQDRQKQFLMSFKNALAADWTKLPLVVEEATGVLGNAFTPHEIAGLAYFSRRVQPENILMGQIPVVPGRGTFLRVDERRLEETLQEYHILTLPEFTLTAGVE
jgi:LCP family protein required for cell wall assembly